MIFEMDYNIEYLQFSSQDRMFVLLTGPLLITEPLLLKRQPCINNYIIIILLLLLLNYIFPLADHLFVPITKL